jgi:hypothetical protein
MANDNRLITIPIKDLVEGLLGYGYTEKQRIPKHIADIIHQHLQNKTLAHVQYEDEDTLEELERPWLWDIGFWVTSTEKLKKAKMYSDKEREIRYVLQHNVDIVAPYISTFLGIEDMEKCKSKAYDILKNNKIKYLIVMGFDTNKLIKSTNEIN